MAKGDIILVKTQGSVGLAIGLLQVINLQGSEYTHAAIDLGDGTLLEAEPGGARIAPISEYHVDDLLFSNFNLTDIQRDKIVEAARSLVGTPYSYTDYLSLALLHWHIRPQWVLDYVKNTDHMICSQICDWCYLQAGIHLFTDNRFPGDVTPGALTELFITPPYLGPISSH